MCCKPLQIKERLQEGYKVDVDPPLSDSARYMREDMSLQGYRHLLAVGVPHCTVAVNRRCALIAEHMCQVEARRLRSTTARC